MKKKLFKRMVSMLLAAMMVLSMVGCGEKKDKPIELTVYSQLANYSGEQMGWFAQVMLEKFNVKLMIIPDEDGVFDTRMESGNLGDLVIFGSTGSDYKRAVEADMLFDWEADDVLKDYGTYMLENMSLALEANRGITPAKNKIYGIGHNVAPTAESYEEFFYTWDLRWDLYKQLGYPVIKNMDDLVTLFEQMKEICPTDDNGNETYAMSLWPDWDGSMVMYVKSMATAYWGYDEMSLGVYDTENGVFHDALEENGPYLTCLKFFNTLYRKDLLDPNSMTQTYNEAVSKLSAGGAFFSIFNYAGNIAYNSDAHIAENKYMTTLLPEEAVPLTYGMSVYGGNRVWSIGANTQYPELCMEIINWLATPEGRMVSEYGPQGVTWDYDEEGNTYLTDLGKLCVSDDETQMTGDYAGSTYGDGRQQINNVILSINAANPDSNGETFNYQTWKSNVAQASCDMEQDWRDYTGALTPLEYIKTREFRVAPATTYSESVRSEELEVIWNQVKDCIVKGSWNAIYAKTDEEYDAIVAKMIKDADAYGYDTIMEWCLQEVATRRALEEATRQ